MNCPKCRTQRLARLRVPGESGAWSCPACHGVWLPEHFGLDHLPETLPSAEGRVEQDQSAGLCPEGHGILTRARTHLPEGFFLERCSTCHGLWFDRGEWQGIAAAGLTGNLADLWTLDWQKARRSERGEEKLAAQLQAELGPDLVSQIEALGESLRKHPSRSLAIGHLLRTARG